MRAALLIAFVVIFQSGVMAQYVPPDFYGEPYSKQLVFLENKGQLVDQYGDGADGVKYYTLDSTHKRNWIDRQAG
jgi:hypothetical protein